MIVQCQQCDTKFNLDETKIPAEGAWVRCSKCQEVFQVMPPGGKPPAMEDEEVLDLDNLPPGGPPGDVDFGLDVDKAPAGAKGGGRGKGFKVIFWLLAILVLLPVLMLGALVALDRLHIAPALVERFRGLPAVGSLLGKAGGAQPAATATAPDNAGLALAQVRGYFRVNQQSGRIFVIQGLVENQQQQNRSGILVRGKLNDEQGAVVRQAVVYAGPIFNPDELRQLSLDAIQARLGQPASPDGTKYAAGPGGNIPFMIVFGNLPDNLSHFTAEVVGSEPTAPSSTTAR